MNLVYGYGVAKYCGKGASISFFFFFFFKLKTAAVVLGSPKVYHFYGTKIHFPTTVNQSSYGNWQVVLIPWMCLPASEMVSYEKGSLVFETEVRLCNTVSEA